MYSQNQIKNSLRRRGDQETYKRSLSSLQYSQNHITSNNNIHKHQTSTMRLSIASIALLTVSILSVASAKSKKTAVGICSCFNPKYDASCCIPARGYMDKNADVCMTSNPDKTIPIYQACCVRSGGKYKCKHGIQDYPPSDTYSCKA